MFTWTQDRGRRAEEILAELPRPRAAVLPLLWLVQEQEGWVTPEGVRYVAALTGATEAELREVLSFYTMLRDHPPARHRVEVCCGLSCKLRGGDALLGKISSGLGIEAGQERADGSASLARIECVGACHRAPVLRVNDELHECVGEAKVEQLLEEIVR